MQKVKALLLALAISCGLVGCGQESVPDVSSVTIRKDGTIAHQIVGNFEQNYYELDGLETLASDRVAEYCADNGENSVTLSSVEEKDGKVLIQLNYASDRDYSDFNHRELYVGKLSEADVHGYQLKNVTFVTAKGESVGFDLIEDQAGKRVVVIATKPSEELVVNTNGKVLYINQSAEGGPDVSFDSNKSVHITYPANEDTDESVLSYIVFE